MIIAVLVGGGVLLPMSALVMDVGSLYLERGELQRGADAAAAAVAKACVAGDCVSTGDINAQNRAAKNYANANAKDGAADVLAVCGNWGNLPACPASNTNLTACTGPVPTGKYVEVRVRTENSDGTHLLPPKMARTFVGNTDYQGTAVGACARATSADVCVSADEVTYKHTFNGPAGTATITANNRLCQGEQQPFSLIAYTAPDDQFAVPQYLYDYETKSITSEVTSLSFKVDVPACYTQVDFVFGSEVFNPLTGVQYGYRKLGDSGPPGNRSSGPPAWYNGGTRKCDPRPTVAFASQSDGLQVTLSNSSSANIDAAFTVTDSTGKDQFLRVEKGKSTTVKIDDSVASTVSVLDNTGKTSNGKWTKPRR